jgi:GAF domain-containing protein
MLNIIQNFFKPPTFKDDPKIRVGVLVFRTLLFAWVLPPLLLISAILLKVPGQFYIPVDIGVCGVIVFLTWLVRRGQVRWAAIGLIATFYLVLVYINYLGAGEIRPAVIVYGWLIVAAGLLLGSEGSIIAAGLLIAQQLVIGWFGLTGTIHPIIPPATPLVGSISVIIGLLLIAATYSLAAGSIQTALSRIRISERFLGKSNLELQELAQTLEQRVEERTRDLTKSNDTSRQRAYELQIVAEVGKAVASVRNLNDLLPEITRIISDRFSYYHAGIFLLDEKKEYAVLRAANSVGGQRMLSREHKLRVEATSIVGYVCTSGRARIASDVGADVIYFRNPDLPDTHSEIALPLSLADNLIGVLDIQSTLPAAFGEEEIEVLGTLANQVAIAIENATLFGQTRQALTEAQAVYDQFIAGSWTRFSRRQPTIGYRFDKGRTTPLLSRDEGLNPPGDTTQAGMVFQIKIRNQVIGELNIRANDPTRSLTEDELAITRVAVERAAIALESARLLDDAQRRASKERAIGEISTRIGSTPNVEAIMRVAAQELGKIISGSEVTIQLEPSRINIEKQRQEL